MSELFGNTDETAVAMIPQEMRGDPLVRLAIEKDFDANKLEKVIDLFNKQEDRRIREDFETVFAKMRSELPIIRKETQGHTNKYASLESIQKACAGKIAEYGFSYRWREEAIPGQQGKRVILTITRKGYGIENYFDVPPLPTNGATNAVQAAGGMSSYGKRYTFVSGFGLIVEGEDTDGSFTLTEVETAEPYKALITAAQTKQDLVTVFGRIWKETADNKHVQKLVQAAYEARKREIA